jgi:hypothetical protein
LYIRDAEKYFILKEIFKALGIKDRDEDIYQITMGETINNVDDVKAIINKIL